MIYPEKLLSLAICAESKRGLGRFIHFLFPHFTFFLSEFQDFSMPCNGWTGLYFMLGLILHVWYLYFTRRQILVPAEFRRPTSTHSEKSTQLLDKCCSDRLAFTKFHISLIFFKIKLCLQQEMYDLSANRIEDRFFLRNFGVTNCSNLPKPEILRSEVSEF